MPSQPVTKKPRQTLVKTALVIGLAAALLQIGRATADLVGLVQGHNAIDLRFYYRWTHEWFTGQNIYTLHEYLQGYPPASILLLYPFTGWMSWEQSRWLWATLNFASIAVVVLIAIRATHAKQWHERVFLLLLVLLCNGTQVTVTNGQASLYVLAQLLAAILILHSYPPRWRTDLAAAVLFIGALLKPNLSLPFVWLLVIFPNSLRIRPLLLVGIGYFVLSLWAAEIVGKPLVELGLQFLGNRLAQTGISQDPNLHFVLARLGLEGLSLPVSAIIFAILGMWAWRFRRADIWLLLGVSAIVTRFWGFHWIYDNVLLIIPEITLFGIWRQNETHQRNWALLLLGLNALAILPPGNFGGQAAFIQYSLLVFQSCVWLATLAYLIWYTRLQSDRDAQKYQPVQK